MKLIDEWDRVIKHAWSIKFSIASAILGGAEVAVQLWKPPGIPDGIFAGFAAMVSIGAAATRLLQQKELSGAKDGTDQ